MNVHEVVDDDLGGPVLVTYRPICRGGMVAERVVDGAPMWSDASGAAMDPTLHPDGGRRRGRRVFSDSEAGVADDSNLVMYDDRTDSYRSQTLAQGIRGPKTEERLSIRPSAVTTRTDRRDRHPDAEALPPPVSGVADPPI